MQGVTFLQIVQLCTILIGFLGVGVSLRSHRRQMYAQMYIEFSSRFHNVLRMLPAAAWTNSADGGELPPRHEELTKTCMQCFHIIGDLYRLHRAGYITPELWKPWQRGIRRAMQRPILQREWQLIEGSFDHDPELCCYIRRMIGRNSATERREP